MVKLVSKNTKKWKYTKPIQNNMQQKSYLQTLITLKTIGQSIQ